MTKAEMQAEINRLMDALRVRTAALDNVPPLYVDAAAAKARAKYERDELKHDVRLVRRYAVIPR